jgi:hypothetical protein
MGAQYICVLKLHAVSDCKRPASVRLASELEALGRAFEREAIEIETRLPHRSSQQSVRVSQYYVEAGQIAEAVFGVLI